MPASTSNEALVWCRKALYWWLPILYLLIVDSFYLRTYDSAQIKITLLQMGGLCLVTLWLCLIALEGWKAFGKEDLVVLAPFLAYLAVVVFSYSRAPYPGPSLDDFIRYIFYMSVAIMVIREFDAEAMGWLTRVLVLATWITVLYGTLQWVDTHFFPPGPGNGVDPFIWRGAFGRRVFSTFGNPNFFANFLVLVFPVLVTQFLKTRAWNLMVLIGLLLGNLFWTETKGAWIGFAVSTSIFLVVYAYFFTAGDRARALRRSGAIALVILLLFGGLVFYYVTKRKTSVSFRVLTWLSTWEMIEKNPWLGTGVGSFKVIYPTYRRPGIFHIEGKHNTETDHAEDEWLEQWFDHGVLGFGLFLWLILSTCWIGVSALSQLTSNLAQRGGRPPPRAYDLLGYLIAFLGMLAHNSFDVSLRFVSSGVFLGLLPGVIINLARGSPLWWFHQRRTALEKRPPVIPLPEEPIWKTGLLWLLRLGLMGAFGWTVYTFYDQFHPLQGTIANVRRGGDALQWWISWSAFWALSLGWGCTFVKASLLSRNPAVPILVAAMLPLLHTFWGFFRADIHHNIAIFHSKQRQWNRAIENYRIVNRLNPYFIMPYYFRGNVFNDRFDMKKRYHPKLGDPKDTPREDFERAMEAYARVRTIAPSYVQMHHQVGVLYLKMAEHLRRQGAREEAERFYDRALQRFQLYHELDPVFPLNYYRMAQIYLARGQHDKAIERYREYIEAPRCHGHPGLEGTIGTKGHEKPDAYTNLANAYSLKRDFENAKKAYRKALELDPSFENARRNLAILEGSKR